MAADGTKIAAQVITSLLLFFLVMGMASTVDIRDLRRQLRNFKAVSIGLLCQFVLLPFLGFIVVWAFNLPPPVGVTLIIVVSSPGGSYSNWWCSLLNADLGLSVSMTTASTILSVGFLPLNLFVYSYAAYGNAQDSNGNSIFDSIDFAAIFYSLAVVIAAIAVGIFCSWKFDTPRWHRISYLGGNISGVLLIIFSIIFSFVSPSSANNQASEGTTSTEDNWMFLAVPLPCLFGLGIASALASCAKLPKPERLTTAVECCYQNTGIATSAALSLFTGDDLNQAMKVPVIYGFTEAIAIGIYLIVLWKLGWSKAPKDEKCCTVITKSYELHDNPEEGEEGNSEEGDTEEGGDTCDSARGEEGSTVAESTLSEPLLDGSAVESSSDSFLEQGDADAAGSMKEADQITNV